MEKSSGATFIGLGIVLLIVGAVMRYAVTVHAAGLSIHTAGWIAMIMAGAAMLLGFAMLAWTATRRAEHRRRSVERASHPSRGGGMGGDG